MKRSSILHPVGSGHLAQDAGNQAMGPLASFGGSSQHKGVQLPTQGATQGWGLPTQRLAQAEPEQPR
jgi:hypothetical protein